MQARLTICSDPFRPANQRLVDTVRRRRKLAPRTRSPVVCQVNGKWISRKAWSMRVNDGDAVIFVVLPQGGGQGGSNPLKAVLMIVVMIFAWYAAPYVAGVGASTTTVGLVQSAISIAGPVRFAKLERKSA